MKSGKKGANITEPVGDAGFPWYPWTASPANGDDAPLLFELYTPRHGIHATDRLEGGEFVVQVGSQSRGTWASKETGHTSYGKLLAKLVTTGVLSYQNGRCLFTEKLNQEEVTL